MRVIVIRADEPPRIQELEPGLDPLLEALGADCLQALPVGPLTAYLDEEAKIRDDKVPVYNPFATFLLHDHVPIVLNPMDVIVGTLVLCGAPDEEGDDTDVTDEDVDLVMSGYERFCALVC